MPTPATSRQLLPTNLLPRGLSRVEAAAYIGASASLFDIMVRERSMPGAKRIRRRLVWDRHQLDSAFDALPDDGEQDSGEEGDGYAQSPRA
jgi:hypothetical protein